MFQHQNHYGLLTFGLASFLAIVISYMGLNLVYNQYAVDLLWPHDLTFDYVSARNYILKFNFISGLIIFFGFLGFTWFKYPTNGKLIRILFPFAVITLQFFVYSTLFDYMQQEDNYEYNSDIGIVWILIWPMELCVLIIFSFIFDRLKNIRLKQKE